MIGDDFGQIGRVGALGNDRSRVRDMLKERPVGEERASRHEDDARVGAAVACKIRGGNRASVFEHDVKDKDFRFVCAEKVRRLILTRHDMNLMALSFQVSRPDFRKLCI